MHNYEITYELGEETHMVTYCTGSEKEAQEWFLSNSRFADAVLISINRQKIEQAINTFSEDKYFILKYSVDGVVFEDEFLAENSSQAFLTFKKQYGPTYFDRIKILSIEENTDKSKEYLQQRIDALEKENYTPKISPIEEQILEEEAHKVAGLIFASVFILVFFMLLVSSC